MGSTKKEGLTEIRQEYWEGGWGMGEREREKIATEMERLGSERQLHKIMTERGTEIIIAR